MQGVGDSNNRERILIIGATNKPWSLDGAFLRPGRFDDKIYVPLPDEAARGKIIRDRVAGVPIENDVDIEYLARVTEGYNGADVDYLCEKAKEFALRRLIDLQDGNEILTKSDFDLALGCVKSSVLEIDKMEMDKWMLNNRA
jgi:transitional endoplasmic reticulum ATPase